MCPELSISQPVAHTPLCQLSFQGESQKPDLETETTFKLSMRRKSSFTVFSLYLKIQADTNPYIKIA